MLTDQDIYLFREGTHGRLFDQFGCRLAADGSGAHFRVWAPNAAEVSVVGDWNGWNAGADRLAPRSDESGIWEGLVPGARHGQPYKYRIVSRAGGFTVEKADPFGVLCELPPATASRVWTLEYTWNDAAWMSSRAPRNALDAPMSIYELHAGSWRRKDGNFLNYRELAHALADYLDELGFTHVELMPVTEHPFYGSWGYQTTGYFAPTARYGTPQDLMYFVDHLHQRGIGVILDWVPSHFPADQHGLAYFDGTHLYEHADPRQGFHPEWNSAIFNLGRNEVRSFLVSSALFWFEKYHIDGLRVDAVASMLYLDYARKEGEWIPNRFGGRENLEAIDFLRILNHSVYRDYPGVAMIAEESTAWPMVSRPPDMGGLGFGLKWNMGWMHDTLAYMKQDPIHRKYHHGELTFSLIYAFNENFVLPLSHDEVVYGKGSLIGKMPGDDWQMFANLRTLFGYMWAHPGKKLLFMGGEFAQRREWTHEGELEWWVSELPGHSGVKRLIGDLNRVYRRELALHQIDFSPEGFEWVDVGNAEMSIIAFLRKSAGRAAPLLVVCNFTPVPRANFLIGVPARGIWREIINTDAREYGGSGWGNLGGVESVPVGAHGRVESINLNLPPLSTLILRWEPRG
ncbi:MAG TPA: 1,4-alpha-glucan branching protein GlgB [Steroidobacteraceae bacterium]|nr:1,4-alpha-glucan branching protein GlgB [Steroidobacteraceae bacterium]